MKNDDDFYAGLAVSLQVICHHDDPVIAQEIVNGLGSEISDFGVFLVEQGGVDEQTYYWMQDNGFDWKGEL